MKKILVVLLTAVLLLVAFGDVAQAVKYLGPPVPIATPGRPDPYLGPPIHHGRR